MSYIVPIHRLHRPLKPVTKVGPRPVREAASNRKLLPMIVLIIAHIPLGIVMQKVPLLATLHALVVFLIGLRWALVSQPDLFRVACVGAYITGAEVLWRLSEARVFWEYGKYSTAALFIIAVYRSDRSKVPVLAVLYFALLLPSAAMVVAQQGIRSAQDALSFDMSGPFAMMVAAWFFFNLKLTREQLQQVLLSLILPLVSIAFVTLFVKATTEEIRFGSSSKALSGGFGPNQVSAALGLGFLVALLILLIGERRQIMKVLLMAVMIFFGAQSLMTFSRGGMYNAIGAIVVASLFLLRDSRTLLKLIVAGALVLMIGVGIVLPRMNKSTGGALLSRFQDTEMSGRESLVELDLQIWFENPVLGVGPGEAKTYKEETSDRGLTAHTEFTRLLSEHGSFGLVALLLLVAAGVVNVMGARAGLNRALAAATVCWSFLFMANAAMRLVAPAFMFGLAFITLLPAEYRNLKNSRLLVKARPGPGKITKLPGRRRALPARINSAPPREIRL